MSLKNLLSSLQYRHCVTVALLLFAKNVDAAVISSESFNYSAGSLNGADPGTSWNNDWVASSGTVVTSSLVYPSGGGTSSGGSVQAVTTGSAGGLNATIQFGTGFQFNMTDEGTTRYASYLGSKPATATSSSEYLQMAFGGNAWIFGMSSGDGFFLQTGSDQAFSANSLITTNTTYLLISKLVTSASGNDTLYLSWYAPGDTVPILEPTTWMLSLSKINATAGAQSSVTISSGNALGTYQMDEIRLGTTWTDVAPEPGRSMLLLMGCMSLLMRRRR